MKGEDVMIHINKVKTFTGVKWALVQDGAVVEYKASDRQDDWRVAVFPLTQDGFEQAKELRKQLK